MPDPPTTQNHDLPLVPPVGDENADDYENEWGDILNDSGWSQLEQLLVARDIESNRTEYEPYDNALFWATDSGAVYVGDGTEWSLRDAEFASLVLSSLVISGDITTDTGNTIWDSTTDSVPTESLSDDSVTIADNTVSLGGSVSVDHGDLSLVSDDDHHSYPVPNSGLVNDSVSVAGNSVDLGESISVAHADLSAVSDDDHHSYPVPNTGLVNDSVSVAGNSVSLGGSTSVAHADLSSVGDDDHHSYPVPNTGLVNDSVSVAGNSVDLGGSISVAHADLSAVSDDDHHSYPVPNSGLVNDSVSVAGNSVNLGGSTGIAHADLDGVSADDHHVAHEHPGDRAASSNLNMSGNNIQNVGNLSGEYAYHGFEGTSYNIDLQDSTADARYRNTSNDTIIWFRENNNVEIPNGELSEQGNRVATRTWANSNFNDYTFSESHNDLTDVGSSDHHTRYSDNEAVSAVDSEISSASTSISGLDSTVNANISDISSLESNKLDSANYSPLSDIDGGRVDTFKIGTTTSSGAMPLEVNGVGGGDVATFYGWSDTHSLVINYSDIQSGSYVIGTGESNRELYIGEGTEDVFIDGTHSSDFAIDGDEQPPEEHGSESHSSDVVHDGQNATLGDTTHDSVDTEHVDISEGIKLPIKEEGDSAEEGEIAVSPDGTLLVAQDN